MVAKHHASGRDAEAAPPTTNVLASKLKLLRRHAGLTLQQLGERCAISASTLSKIENGQLSPTYEKIAALAAGLQVDVGELFSPASSAPPLGRRSVTRHQAGVVHATEQYRYEVLHTDLVDKRFIPIVTTIKARERKEFGELLSHAGEEFIYVLSGAIILHSEGYAPLRLEAGDSCYFDSRMGHACTSDSDQEATVMWVSSHAQG